MENIPEKDWKHLYSLKDILVDRFSEQTLSNITKIINSNNPNRPHEKYLKIYRYLEKRDYILGDDLSDFRRSNALYKILGIKRLGLFTDEEFEGFSEEIKKFYEKF